MPVTNWDRSSGFVPGVRSSLMKDLSTMALRLKPCFFQQDNNEKISHLFIVVAGRSRTTLRALFFFLMHAGIIAIPSQAETLTQALRSAYDNNPRIALEQQRLRASEEEISRVQSGYLPSVTGRVDVGYEHRDTSTSSVDSVRHPRGYQLELTQNIFSGFQTKNAVSESEARTRAQEQTLRLVVQDVLGQAVTAYMDVLRDQEIVRLNERNVNILSKELRSANERYGLGDVTKTDTAQARGRRAGAVANLHLSRANLKSSRARYTEVIGHAPNKLKYPNKYGSHLPKSLQRSLDIAMQEHPDIVALLYQEDAARFAISRIRGELLPTVDVSLTHDGRWGDGSGTSSFGDKYGTTAVVGRLNIPFYRGGEVRARVRKANHEHLSVVQGTRQARQKVRSDVASAWALWTASKEQVASTKIQVTATRAALKGVREEERLGARDLLDILNAEQELLNARTQLARVRHALIVNAYAVLSMIGRLDAVTLGIDENVENIASIPEPKINLNWLTSVTRAR